MSRVRLFPYCYCDPKTGKCPDVLRKERTFGKAVALLSLFVSTHGLPAAYARSGEPTEDEFVFAMGMADGCIDAQRRLHAAQGRAFNPEAVRNLCYCMAGRLVERIREQDFQARVDAREATATAAVDAIESTCKESVGAGRKYAP